MDEWEKGWNLDLDEEREEKEEQVKVKVKVKSESKIKGGDRRDGKTSARGDVTERDVEIVHWLGRHKLATTELVMRRFGMQRSKAYQRLAILTNQGFVRHEPGIRTSRVFLATTKGLSVADLDLPRARVSAATFAHDIAVAEAAISLERAKLTTVLTEREFRRLDQHDPGQFRIAYEGLPGAADQRGLWPDLVAVDRVSNAMHAIEVELTQKKNARITHKLRAYAASRYATVTYLCAAPNVARVVQEAAELCGLGDRLVIKLGIASATPHPQRADELQRLLDLIRAERSTRVELEQRSEALSAQLDRERRAGFAIIEDIARYLSADKPTRQVIRRRWVEMTERFNLAQRQGFSIP